MFQRIAVRTAHTPTRTHVQSRAFGVSAPTCGYIQLKRRSPSRPWLNGKESSIDPTTAKDYVPTASESDIEARPSGVGAEFFARFFRLKHAAKRRVATPVSVGELLQEWKLPGETDYFLSALADNAALRNRHYLSSDEESTVLNNLITHNAPHRVVKVATEPAVFMVRPSEKVLRAAMVQLLESVRAGGKIAALDNMYKLFAAMVYWNVVPGTSEYSALVIAGKLVNTTEGTRRSKVTAAEAKTLQIELNEEAAKVAATL